MSDDGSNPRKSSVVAPIEENVKRIDVTPERLPSPETVATAVQEYSRYRWWSGDKYREGYRDKIGFPDLKMHEFRHTQATMLLGNGVDE